MQKLKKISDISNLGWHDATVAQYKEFCSRYDLEYQMLWNEFSTTHEIIDAIGFHSKHDQPYRLTKAGNKIGLHSISGVFREFLQARALATDKGSTEVEYISHWCLMPAWKYLMVQSKHGTR